MAPNNERRENKTDIIMCCDKIKAEDKKVEEKIPFEEALLLAGSGKYSYIVLWFCGYNLIAACMEIFSVGTLVTSSQCDLELDLEKKGLIGSVPMLGVIVSAHFWGYLADTRGRKLTLIITSAGTFITAILSSFATDWIFMTIAKFFSAVCVSGSIAVTYTLLGECTPETRRGMYLLYAATVVMLCQAAIAMFSYPILRLTFSYYLPLLNMYFRPWRLLAQVIGLTSGIALIICLVFIYESPKFLLAKGEHDKGLEVLQNMFRINSGRSKDEYTVKRVYLEEEVSVNKKTNILRSMWDQTVPLFGKKHWKKTLLICYVGLPSYCIPPPLSIWLPEILNIYSSTENPSITFCESFHEKKAINVTTIEVTECNDYISDFTFIALTSFAFYLTFCAVINVIIVKFIGKKFMFIGIHVICAIFTVLINRFSALWGILYLVGMMGYVVCMGLCTTYAVELFPTNIRAMAVCLTMMSGRAVSFIFINITGKQLLTNCDNFLYIIAVFILSGAVMALLLPPDKKPSQNKTLDVENNDKSINNNDSCAKNSEQ